MDEVHTLVGAGATSGAMDASNMLKPALARGTLHFVGATTLDEYRKHIEKDGALARRFQTVYVREVRTRSCVVDRWQKLFLAAPVCQLLRIILTRSAVRGFIAFSRQWRIPCPSCVV